MTEKHIQLIETSKIYVLNPRERNELIKKEIKANIEQVGLKRPITVRKKDTPVDGFEYDLVCGQGRLEAFKENNQKEIPAIVINVDEKDALVMSLVENIARRNYRPVELLQGVKRLKEKGYSAADISQKTGLTREYIVQINTLLSRGEEKLLNAVEQQKIPLNVAIDISYASDDEIQGLLQEAYEKKLLRGNKLNYVRALIERRKKSGKELCKRGPHNKISSVDLNNLYEKEINKKKLLIRKASRVENSLIVITQSFKQLFQDDNFMNLLKAEGLNKIPKYITERIKADEGNVNNSI